jgi:hypothetical protein
LTGAAKLVDACKTLGIVPSHVMAASGHEVIIPHDEIAYHEVKARLQAAGMQVLDRWEWPTRLPDGRKQKGADLFTWEVLVEFYRLDISYTSPRGWKAPVPTRAGAHYSGTKVFSRADPRVNAAMAATSRAFARLGQRGLVFVGFAGVHLTRQGIEEAQRLMANGDNNIHTDNR